ncbi:MAG: streptogramin lyase [Verrucomicrobiales bacterium]|jgi:streptogramin lyase
MNCAAEFSVEDLGPVEKQTRIRGYARSPGTADYPPRLLIGFVDGDGTWIVNLEDGSARKAEASGFENDYLQWPTFIGADGKVFTSCGRGGLSIYDPVADTIDLIRPIADARWLRGMAIGPNGSVYVSDYPTGSAAKYDPGSGEVIDFGPQGGPFNSANIYGYSVGFDGRYVYTAAGKLPWFVVAYDTHSKTQSNLLQFAPADHPEVHQRGDKVYLDVALSKPKSGQAANLFYQLVDGKAKAVEAVPKYDDSHVPGVDDPQPEIDPLDRGLPIIDGVGAQIRFRKPGEDWESATIPVEGNNMVIERISALSDGRLLVSAGPYGNVHFFDPETDLFTRLGNPDSKNVYDMLEVGGSVWFCGYPNSILGIFNEPGGEVIGNWHDSLGSKHALFILEGADGRIYSGNHNERESTGGALGWYDPRTSEYSGIHFPNDDCEFLTSAMDGKLIIYASDFSHDPSHPEITKRNGQLIFYDTTVQKITRRVSPLSDGSAGIVIETEPGVLFGFGLHDKLPMMYRVEIASGEVTQRVPLPGKAIRSIALGPDGKVYFFVNDSLIRVNPKTFELETLCAAEAGRMVFIGDDLYFAGTSNLRRIRGVAKLAN